MRYINFKPTVFSEGKTTKGEFSAKDAKNLVDKYVPDKVVKKAAAVPKQQQAAPQQSLAQAINTVNNMTPQDVKAFQQPPAPKKQKVQPVQAQQPVQQQPVAQAPVQQPVMQPAPMPQPGYYQPQMVQPAPQPMPQQQPVQPQPYQYGRQF